MNRAVFAHTAGFAVSESRTCEMYQAPKFVGQLECSLNASGAAIQETWGSVPAVTSARSRSK